MATVKLVAVEEEGEGGPETLDLTKWDFNKADCRTRCRNLIENSKLLLLMGSPMDSDDEDEEQSRAVLHLAFIYESYEILVRERQYLLHTHSHSAKIWDHPTVVDFMNGFPDTFQAVIDKSLFGPNVPHGMNTLTRWLTNSGCVAQALSSLTHSSTTAMSQQLQSDLCVAAAKDQPQHRPLLPKLDILMVDPDEELQEEWEAEDDVTGGPLDPHEVNNARDKETVLL